MFIRRRQSSETYSHGRAITPLDTHCLRSSVGRAQDSYTKECYPGKISGNLGVPIRAPCPIPPHGSNHAHFTRTIQTL